MGTHLNYLDKFMKAYAVSAYMNCLDLLRQFFLFKRKVEAIQVSAHNICYYKEVDKIARTATRSLRHCLSVYL